MNLDPYSLVLPNEESTKYSQKQNGIIHAYAANTNQGIIRNYNEDRVSIILNIVRPKGKEHIRKWPKCSFFAVYDGHGGNACADFLKDNLHQFIIRQDCFPNDPEEAIRKGCSDSEKLFTELAEAQLEKTGELDRSGSCAICVLFVDDTVYSINVGDSRSMMSKEQGAECIDLSDDHRPEKITEQQRITGNGGHIYQTQNVAKVPGPDGVVRSQVIMGPLRVFPGRLSVSRTFGDVEAKLPRFGGNPNVVIAEPDIEVIRVDRSSDFIILACDGIFDKLTNKECVDCVW